MSREDLKKYFEILELSSHASLQDIKNAYLRLKKLYSSDSIVLMPLGDEFPERKRKKILNQIEEAYARLLFYFKSEPQRDILPSEIPVSEKVSFEENMDYPSFSGQALKEIREKRGIELSEISNQLKLRIELLKNIENEKFEALPEEAYLRTQLKNYAACLSLNHEKVVEDYLRRYKEWKDKI